MQLLPKPERTSAALRLTRGVSLLILLCAAAHLTPTHGAPPDDATASNNGISPQVPYTAVYLYNFTEASKSQVIRLRGHRPHGSPHVGRVEIIVDGRWSLVCGERWTRREATVACRMLGYRNGAPASESLLDIQNDSYWNLTEVRIINVACNGREESLDNCINKSRRTCREPRFAAVECLPSASECLQGEIYANDMCYLPSSQPTTYYQAERVCDIIGGNLAWIDTLETNRHASEILATFSNTFDEGTFVLSESLHNFLIPTNATLPRLLNGVTVSAGIRCLSLRRSQKEKGEDFFNLTPVTCKRKLPYLCEVMTLQKRRASEPSYFLNEMNVSSEVSVADDNYKLRIYNGHPSAVKWQALLRMNCNDESSLSCGGSILSEEWILTAAHCCCEDGSTGSSTVYVGLSEFDKNKINEIKKENKFSISKCVPHTQYDSHSDPEYDFAMVKLETKINFEPLKDYDEDGVASISLPLLDYSLDSSPSATCSDSGWGTTHHASGAIEKLNKASAELRRTETSNLAIHTGYGSLNGMVCPGDSGGPLYCQPSGTSQYFLVGVTSRSMAECLTNSDQAAFGNVYLVKPWINDIMSSSLQGVLSGWKTEAQRRISQLYWHIVPQSTRLQPI